MVLETSYDKFIVQSLVGNHQWSSSTNEGSYFHIGTIPNKHNNVFIFDLRMMIYTTEEGYKPLCAYARKARAPMQKEAPVNDSWEVLGTNLSVKLVYMYKKKV